MANEQIWKTKYQDLKMKFINAVDNAFRMGMEQGLLQAQLQQAQDQQMQMQAQAQQGQGSPAQSGGSTDVNGNEIGQTSDTKVSEPKFPEPGQEPEQSQQQHPSGTPLDQHISELEGLMGKSELSSDDLKKALEHIQLIKNEAHSHPVPEMSPNLDHSSKAALKMQSDIVSKVFSNWEKEERRASSDILNTLNMDGLLNRK